MTRYSFKPFCLAAVLLLAASTAIAAPTKVDSVKKTEPNVGLLSTSQRGGTRNTVVDTGWSSSGGVGSTNSPIAGSVSRISPREWKLALANNSEDTYSVDLSVQQIDNRGSVAKTDHFSYTLRGGQSVERTVPSSINSVDAKLNLGNWKNLTPPKKVEADAAKEGAKPAAAAPAAK